MTDQEMNNLMIDYTAAASNAIPYVGSIISLTIKQFKTPQQVINWTDIEDYVDAAINAATLKNNIQTWQNALGTLMADLNDYQANANTVYSDKLYRWHFLQAKIEDADKINQAILGQDGGEVTYVGLWRQSPFGMVDTIGQLLLINTTIFDEMKILVKLGQVPHGETGSSIQPSINRVLRDFVKACKVLVPLSYQQRMADIKVLADNMNQTIMSVPPSGGMAYPPHTYDEYNYHWSDASVSGSGLNYTHTLTDPSDSQRYAEEAKIAKYRVKWLDYWFATHQQVVSTLRLQITNVIDGFLSYDQDIYNTEIAHRRSTGCVFGAASLHVEISDSHCTDPAKGSGTKFDTTLYWNQNGGIHSGSRNYIPFFQYYLETTYDKSHVTCWCMENEQNDTVASTPGHPQLTGTCGIYSFFTSPKLTVGNNMLPVFWSEATAYANGKITANGSGWKVTWYLPHLTRPLIHASDEWPFASNALVVLFLLLVLFLCGWRWWSDE